MATTAEKKVEEKLPSKKTVNAKFIEQLYANQSNTKEADVRWKDEKNAEKGYPV